MKTQKTIYGMYQTKLDPNGKIQLPAKVRAFLSGNVVLTGHGDHLELWDQEEFERQFQCATEEDEGQGEGHSC